MVLVQTQYQFSVCWFISYTYVAKKLLKVQGKLGISGQLVYGERAWNA